MPRERLRRAPALLAEMAVIVFSVLLALGANEWRQAMARNATVATVRETMRAEATSNRTQVERALAHHQDLLAQLRSGGIELARLPLRESGIDTTSAAAVGRTTYTAALRLGAPLRTEFIADRHPDGGWRLRHEDSHYRLEVHGDSAVIRGTGNISLQPPFLVDSAWETAQVTHAAVHMDPAIIASLARARQLARHVDFTTARIVDMLYGSAAATGALSALSDLAMYEQALLDAYDDLLTRL
jgi:3-polyprenyl-4-hydroxybenzoate decarboxylase